MARHFRLNRLFPALVLLIANPVLAQQTCSPPSALDQSIPAGALKTLRIETGTGLLRVEGMAEADEIRISGRACADEAATIEAIGYNAEIDDKTLGITDRLPEGANHPEALFARMDLQVIVPAGMQVEIKTRKEAVSVANVASLSLESWRGDAEVSDIARDATVIKQRGDLTIGNIGGSLTLSRQAGEMIVTNVGGDVLVKRAERGNSRIESVKGSVQFLSNGRGDVAVIDVGGDFTIDSNLAGRIHHSGVEGTVRITEPAGLPEGQQPLDNAPGHLQRNVTGMLNP